MPVVFFRPRSWLPGERSPLYVQSECDTCHRIKGRIGYKRRKGELRARQRRNYKYRAHPRVPAEPFLEWVRELARDPDYINNEMARRFGMHEDRLRQLRRGIYMSKGKHYPILTLKVSDVERWLTRHGGMTFTQLYEGVEFVAIGGRELDPPRCKIRGCNRIANTHGMCQRCYSNHGWKKPNRSRR